MITVFSEDHRLHDTVNELYAGKLIPSFEKPSRADIVAKRIGDLKIGAIVKPDLFNQEVLERVHSRAYLTFLSGFWERWSAAGHENNGYPSGEVPHWMRPVEPQCIEGGTSLYCHDYAAPLMSGTWQAARSSAHTALTAQQLVYGGARSAFALCRPPGHHAYVDSCGGYCYLNNAAIAAQRALDQGARRVAILDVDFHHGNGTQAIFYNRNDVFYGSLHGDPKHSYPYFLGYADERGAGVGEGYNRNCPLLPGTEAKAWFDALELLLQDIKRFGPDELVVSLGVDAFEGDPISSFKLSSDDFLKLGERLGRMAYRTLFVFEGGYDVAALGTNVTNVLQGFLARVP